MKKLLLLFIIASIVSCSGSKQTIDSSITQNNNDLPEQSIEPQEVFPREVTNQMIQDKINKLTEEYSGVSIKSIARSKVLQTTSGYEWKFMNVKTGQNYVALADTNFESVTIYKKPKFKN